MKKHIAVLAGDGIGPEITDGAIAVLNKVGEKFGHEFEFEHLLMGVCAIVTEYGHLLLCAGSEKDARAYAEADARAYAKEYRPVGEKPGKDDVQAAKAEQKRRNEEEKQLRAALSPCRQFDRFTPADLPFLEGKRIFVSERMYGLAASKGEWEAARRSNTIETISGPALGR